MTSEQQRIELAKLDGLKDVAMRYVGDPMSIGGNFLCSGVVGQGGFTVPDYLNNLNAVHELEKKLLDNASMDERSLWLDTLGSCITYRETGNYYDNGFEFHYSVARATAAQRCEAVLKMKGLWR